MMDWTDRHCRTFHRALTDRARLYTEMVTAQAVVRGDRARLLAFGAGERPLALQIGGSDPQACAEAAAIGEDAGFDEINLNVGCPSDRVRSGRFGACLMHDPGLVADCMAAIRGRVRIEATVKCRLGVDDQDPEESLYALVDACASVGVRTFIVHARKAWLNGLSPKENREIPPLDYGLVRRLKAERPHLSVVLNGGLTSIDAALGALDWADGAMIGRAAYHDPAMLLEVDSRIFAAGPPRSLQEALAVYRGHIAAELARGTSLHVMTRPMLGLFAGRPGSRAFRRTLSVDAARDGAGLEVLDRALAAVEERPGAKAAA